MTMENEPTIPEFFSGLDILVTGGTGFMGKVLIEKLLRSCPDVNKIFILIRKKKNKSIEERLKTLSELPLFDRLRNEYPKNLGKMIGINGDVAEIGLGLSDADKKQMENVSVIFHSAASVRFDDSLKKAILMNTRGTREILLFAEQQKNLKVFVHISTTYSNPDKAVIDEKIYESKYDWKTCIKLAETYDENLLNSISAKFTNNAPNTYTFSKGLAESIVHNFSNRLPIVLYRPSIVTSTIDEPIPGWIDNFNGPVSLLVACAIGILRTQYGDPDIFADFVPVDISIKAMIIAAWKHGKEQNKNLKISWIYNCSTALLHKYTNGFIIEIGKRLSVDVPPDRMLFKPGGSITRCKYHNFLRFMFFQLLPAYIVDFIFKFRGKKQFVVGLQRKIYEANFILQPFLRTIWTFKNTNFLTLQNFLKTEDIEAFGYNRFLTGRFVEYYTNCMLGNRRYLLHEKDENLPKARINYKRVSCISVILQIIIVYSIFYWFVFKYLDILSIDYSGLFIKKFGRPS